MASDGFARVKSQFFDRKSVIDAMDKTSYQVLNDFGRAVRKSAQKSLVYDDKPSRPGEPPHAHKSRSVTRTSRRTGKSRTRSVSFLREFLFYFYDKSTKSVVIGPEKLSNTIDPKALPALEYGGSAIIQSRGKTRRASIAARPFMTPVFHNELKTLPSKWKDSLAKSK